MSVEQPCPVCGLQADVGGVSEFAFSVSCVRCGQFRVTLDFAEDFGQERRFAEVRHLVSGALREATVSKHKLPPLTIEIVEQSLLPLAPRTVSQQLKRLLENLSRMVNCPGSERRLQPENDYPLAYARPEDRLAYYLKTLEGMDLVSLSVHSDGVHVQITSEGWRSLEEARSPSLSSRKAFVAMSYADEMLCVCDEGLKPSISSAGYDPVVLREVQYVVQLIPDRMLAEIRSSRFMVADFTGQRHGVYFEAGFALGLGIPVIWTCRRDEIDGLHFDVKQYNHVDWRDTEDLKVRLTARILALIGRGPVAPHADSRT